MNGPPQFRLREATVAQVRQVQMEQYEWAARGGRDAECLSDTPFICPRKYDANAEAEAASLARREQAAVEDEGAMVGHGVSAGDEHGVCLPRERRAEPAVVDVGRPAAQAAEAVARPGRGDPHAGPLLQPLERPLGELLQTQHVRVVARGELDRLLEVCAAPRRIGAAVEDVPAADEERHGYASASTSRCKWSSVFQ